MNIICFHNPNEENGYLSNWYLSDFSVDGIEFTSMEQFMMYRKAICFGNEAIAKEILASKDVAYIKKLGRLVANYNAVKDRIWGIGLSVNDPMRFDINAWKGKNLLGYSLMMVRDNL